jgi:hypothetical protein
MPASPDDWRRTSPGAPKGTHFRWREYVAPRPDWDHDHCLFCWAKFVPRSEEGKEWLGRDSHTIYFDGYATVEPSEPGCEWVCQRCFNDFSEEMEFVIEGPGAPDRQR